MTHPIDTSPEAIAALLDGVTPGPWVAESGHTQQNGQMYWQVSDEYDAIVQNQFCWARGDHAANARFIAASRELVPALAAEIARLTAERDDLKYFHNFHIADGGRLLRMEDVAGVCETQDVCFSDGPHVRCGPCAIKAAQRAGIGEMLVGESIPQVLKLKRALAKVEAERDEARAQVVETVKYVWGRCEALEDEAYTKLEKPDALTEHERGFWASQKMVAKSIRRSTEMPTTASTALAARDAAMRNEGRRQAAKACDWGDIYGDNAVSVILATLEPEGGE